MSVQCQCPFSSQLLKIIMQIVMLLSLHPAMISWLPSTQLVLLCIVQYRQWHKRSGHRRRQGTIGNSLVCIPPPSPFHSVCHTGQKDLLQQSQQLDINAATNGTDLKPKPQKKIPKHCKLFFFFFKFFLGVSNLCVWPEESSAKRWLRFLRLQKYQHPRLQPGDSQDSVTEVALATLLALSERPVCLPYLCHLTVGFVLFWASYVFLFFFLCVARTITPTQTWGWRGAEGRWGGGRYSFKKMEEHALEGHSETGQLKTVPFCCLFFPCQDSVLPRYFTLCLSQNSLSRGWTTNGVSNSCTTVYASLSRVARQTRRLLHLFIFCIFFSRHFRSLWSWQKQFRDEESRECTTGSSCEVFFFFSCGKGVLKIPCCAATHMWTSERDGRIHMVSVVLKERQKVIIAIAWQIRRIQVRKQLIWICEFWKQL